MTWSQHENRTGRYAQLQTRWRLIAVTAELLFLVALATFVHVRPTTWLLVLASVPYTLLMLPIVYHLHCRLPCRFGLTSRRGWRVAGNLGANVLARFGLGLIILMLIFLPRLFAGAWWSAWPIAAWALSLLIGFVFYGRRPQFLRKPQELEATSKIDAMQQFAQQQGFENLRLLSAQAAFPENVMYAASGAYKMRPAAYLSDNIVENLSPRELQSVVAHEMAHLKRRDRLRAAIMWAAAAFCVLACIFASLPYLAPDSRSPLQATRAAPMVLLVTWLMGFLLSPVLLAFSRRCERRANEAALVMTRNPAAFISAMRKLAENNLVAGRPTWWERLLFATHPSLDEVIAQARRYAAEHGISLSDDVS